MRALVALAVLACAGAAWAAEPAVVLGDGALTTRDMMSRGWAFDVAVPVDVVSVGVWKSDFEPFFGQWVELWRDDGTMLAMEWLDSFNAWPDGPVSTTGEGATGRFLYKQLAAPMPLVPGTRYVISAVNVLNTICFNAPATLAPEIIFVEDRWIYSAGLLPSRTMLGPEGGGWFGPGFQFVKKTAVRAVTVDVRPGSRDNPLNLKSRGILPVAVLSDGSVDARNIDSASVALGDPALAGSVVPLRSEWEDVDGDGVADLLMLFSLAEAVEAGAMDADTNELLLTGLLSDGTAIEGLDAVRIVPGSSGGRR